MSRAQYIMSMEECQRAVQRMDGSFFVPAAAVRFMSVIAPGLTGERFISTMDKCVAKYQKLHTEDEKGQIWHMRIYARL